MGVAGREHVAAPRSYAVREGAVMPRHVVSLIVAATVLVAPCASRAAAQVTVRAKRCELVETNRIPAAGATDLELGRIAALAVDGFGHLYVSDQQGPDGHIIRSFTTGGRFLRAIGRVGSGPAE